MSEEKENKVNTLVKSVQRVVCEEGVSFAVGDDNFTKKPGCIVTSIELHMVGAPYDTRTFVVFLDRSPYIFIPFHAVKRWMEL